MRFNPVILEVIRRDIAPYHSTISLVLPRDILVKLSSSIGSLTFQYSGLPSTRTVIILPLGFTPCLNCSKKSSILATTLSAVFVSASVNPASINASTRVSFNSNVLNRSILVGVGAFSIKLPSPSVLSAALRMSSITPFRMPAFIIFTVLLMMLSTG